MGCKKSLKSQGDSDTFGHHCIHVTLYLLCQSQPVHLTYTCHDMIMSKIIYF